MKVYDQGRELILYIKFYRIKKNIYICTYRIKNCDNNS